MLKVHVGLATWFNEKLMFTIAARHAKGPGAYLGVVNLINGDLGQTKFLGYYSGIIRVFQSDSPPYNWNRTWDNSYRPTQRVKQLSDSKEQALA